MIDGIRDERTLNNNVPYGDLAARGVYRIVERTRRYFGRTFGYGRSVEYSCARKRLPIFRLTLVSVMVAGMRDGLLLVSGENLWDLLNIVPISIIQRVTDGVR